jgi:tetratricopeptide (TPR) repeat protein
VSALGRIDEACDSFEDAWKAGKRPPIEDFLAGIEGAERQVLLRQLVRVELDVRRRLGETPSLEEYQRRFPGNDAALAAAWGLPVVPGYEILGDLGRGAMGVVYKARQVGLNRLVALKMILAGGHAGAAELARFRREVEALARLQHANIVQVYEVGEHEGKPFFSLEYCAGGSLDKKLPGAPQPPGEAARLVESLAGAMHLTHSRNVVHRDLKPANVLLTADGTPKITDFGLAKLLDEAGLSVTGSVLGTPSYMAPEQAAGRSDAVGPAADSYALGAILYECLTGHPPFKAESPMDTLVQVINDEPVPPRRLQPKCPRDLETICLKCLHKEPARRYASAQELAGDLGRFLRGEPILARPVGRVERVVKWVKRNKVVAGLLAAFLVALLIALGGGGWAIHQSVQAANARESQARADEAKARAEAEKARAEAEKARAEAAHLAEKRQNAIDKALTAAMGGDLDAAERAIAKAKKAGASAGQVHMLRGQIALHRGQSRKARQHLEKAVRLLRDSVAAWGMLAAAHADDGHWERYDEAIQEMAKRTPLTPEDFLYKGYAEANLEPETGLQTIKQAFDRRPMMAIALLLRAEVRALVAQDTDPAEAEGAVQDARYARELLRDNPAALWVSLNAHLVKAGVHEHRAELALLAGSATIGQMQPGRQVWNGLVAVAVAETVIKPAELKQRQAELELAGKDADALKRFTELPTLLPEAVVYRWLYFREVGRAEAVLEELRRASEQTDHVYVAFCYALTLYRRGGRDDLEKALRVLERRPRTYNDRLLPFVLAELDYPNKQHDWPARALKASEDYTARTQDGAAVMDAQAVLCLLGKQGDAVKASQKLQKEPGRFYTLRRKPILRCLDYNAGDLPADDLVRGAKGSRWDQCLAHYYIAMTKLAKGDRKGAQEHFDKVVKTRATLWGPYDLSWVFQARLAKAPTTWPPWIPKARAK